MWPGTADAADLAAHLDPAALFLDETGAGTNKTSR
jgi:hypothetical protein